MMATTHVLAAMAAASFVAVVAPEFAPVAVAAAAVGGLLPDLDLYADHRRTLHFPVYYTVAAVPAGVLAVWTPTTGTVAVAAVLGGAAFHSLSDALGGGLELRPWEGTSERAVYDHFNGRWLRPRRWVRYDGAPEDVLVAGVVALPTMALAPAALGRLAAALVGASLVYAVLRKRMPALVERVVTVLPPSVTERLPPRFTDGTPR